MKACFNTGFGDNNCCLNIIFSFKDFTYSLSVFISEIPLANMVFDLANSLLQTKTDDEYKELRFKDSDVWCVLNYLGEYISKLFDFVILIDNHFVLVPIEGRHSMSYISISRHI